MKKSANKDVRFLEDSTAEFKLKDAHISSEVNTTQMYLNELEEKAKKNKIKRCKLKLKTDKNDNAKHKLKLMRKLKPNRREIDIFSSDSEN